MALTPESQARPSAVLALWCVICQIAKKHVMNNCHLLQNYMKIPQQLFYNFCRLVGHDDHTTEAMN